MEFIARGSTNLGDEQHLSSISFMLSASHRGSDHAVITSNDHDIYIVLSHQGVGTLPSNCTVALFCLQ